MSPKPGADDPEIANFHYWNPEVQDDPHPFFDRVRGTCPVAWSGRYDGFWLLTKYDDVYRAYQEPGTFSSYPNPIPAEGLGNARPVIPVEIDPPDHTAYREILAPLFTAHRIRPPEAKITAHARELVEGIRAKGSCDYATEFAKVLPTRVFLDMMGWPLTDAPMFLDWTDKLMRDVPGDPKGTKAQKLETGMALYLYFGAELHKREGVEPKRGDEADFIDWLRGARFTVAGAEPRPLEALEILDCIFIVLLAGLDTTQGVLSLSMEYLADNPDYRRQILDDPELIPAAVEELLRWFAPVLAGRRMTRDLELRGVTLREGDRVMLGMGSACRDADEFGDTAGALTSAAAQPAHRLRGGRAPADVVKVEAPGRGDYLDRVPPFAAGHSPVQMTHNPGKRSVHLDVRDTGDRETLLGLAAVADVVVENSRPGVVGRRRGRLRRAAPGAPRAGDLLDHRVRPDRAVGEPAQPRPDHGRASRCAERRVGGRRAPAGLGLHQLGQRARRAERGGRRVRGAGLRARRGPGAWIDVSCWDAAVESHRNEVAAGVASGKPASWRGRWLGAIHEVYQAADDRLVLLAALEPKFWVEFSHRVDRADLLGGGGTDEIDYGGDDPALRRELGKIFAGAAAAEWERRFLDWGVPGGPVLGIDDAVRTEHFRARGLVEAREPGQYPVVTLPVRWHDHGGRAGSGLRPPPGHGADTAEVLADWLVEPASRPSTVDN